MSNNTNALATPAFIQGSPADHTYVVCDGQQFGCFGSSTGGRLLADTAGYNDITKVNKLNENTAIPIFIPGFKQVSISLPTGDAGIIYGVNGVCHMAANRLIVQSRKTVQDAKFSAITFLTYGVYGTRVPVEVVSTVVQLITAVITGPFFVVKAALIALEAMSTPAIKALVEYYVRDAWTAKLKSVDLPTMEDIVASGETDLHGKLALELCKAVSDSTEDAWEKYHRFETEQIFMHFLGETFDREKLDQLILLNEDWDNRELSGETVEKSEFDLCELINNKARDYARECHQILGDEGYKKLFGADPSEEINIIVPALFKTAHMKLEV